MSSVKSTTDKPESRKKRFSLGLRELFGKKKDSQTSPSDISHIYEDSETGSIKKHAHKPSIIVQDESNFLLNEPPDVGALAYGRGSLHVADAQSQQSLPSRKSRTSFASRRVAAQNE
jgi:hypothetical protein